MKVRIEVLLDAEVSASYMKLDGHALHQVVCHRVKEILKDELSLPGVEVKNLNTSHSYVEAGPR